MVAPFPDAPSCHVTAPDGARIAVFSAGLPDAPGPPLLLVHGTTADHRTWRVVAPDLARGHAVHAIDRRGRGDSTDGPPGGYSIERELEDLATVAEALAADAGGPVDVIGHSLGGRIALAASVRTAAIRRVAAYESAPVEARATRERDTLLDALRAELARGDRDGLLARFMTQAVGMPAAELAAFRADAIWAPRAAAAPTIVASSRPPMGTRRSGSARLPA
ncbi:MAG TPA: alpha/beta fold hydrolase [Candidatus Limnocylindrales bacterium]|jgi:pimeloyl-ACP methyl ester carboxylesterase